MYQHGSGTSFSFNLGDTRPALNLLRNAGLLTPANEMIIRQNPFNAMMNAHEIMRANTIKAQPNIHRDINFNIPGNPMVPSGPGIPMSNPSTFADGAISAPPLSLTVNVSYPRDSTRRENPRYSSFDTYPKF